MCTAGKVGRYGSSSAVPDPSEVFQTRRGGATDPHTRLPGYTCSTMLGVTQVWFAAHHVGHVMKTLRSGRLDELHRRMKRNPHVLDARVCRAVLWWSILGEAMEAAKQAERRRAKRRESRRFVVVLAVSQRRGNQSSSSGKPAGVQQQGNTNSNSSSSSSSSSGGGGTDTPQSQQQRSAEEEPPSSGVTRRSSRTWSLPPLTAGDGSQSLLGGSGGGGRAPCHGGEVRRRISVHLDEAAILSRIYEFL